MIRDYPNDRWLGLVSYSICLMQLAEFFIWIDQKCGWVNNLFGHLLPIILWSQAFLFIFGAYYYGNICIDNNLLLPLVIYYAVIFIGSIIFIIYKFYSNNKLCIKPVHNKYLYWYNIKNTNLFWQILYYIPCATIFLIKNIKSLIIYSVFLFTSNILSIFYNIKSWKSIWCFYKNLFPLIVIIVGHYIYKENN